MNWRRNRSWGCSQICAGLVLAGMAACAVAQQPAQLVIHWEKTTLVSNTTPTLQVVVNPPLRHGEPLSTAAYKALKDLGADYVRYVPWLPYPKLAVAELEPPTAQKTSWDFSLIDPMTKDFLAATDGHSTIMNFSTMPAWLFKTDKPITYPADANQVDWDYTQGTELRDPSGKEVGDYYARLVSWYVNGGFTDENGARHDSGYHYKFPYWEVLNEPEFEHSTTPEQYTARYDAIVSAIHAVSPETKFVGMALAMPSLTPGYFEYFLDHKNHRAGIPLDMISYHFYASPVSGQTWTTGSTRSSTRATDFSTRCATSSPFASGSRPRPAPPWMSWASFCRRTTRPRTRRHLLLPTGIWRVLFTPICSSSSRGSRST